MIPLRSLSPVMSAGVGWVLLGELPALTQWAGMGLVVLGAALLGATGEGRANVLGVVMGATVALCFAATIVLDKGALQYVRAPQHGLWTGLTIAGGLLGWLAARGRLRSLGAIGKQVGWIVAAAGTLAAALGLQLLAVQLWLVSVVEGSKRAIGMSAAIVLGSVLFGESISAGKLVAIGLMIAGVVLLV